MAITRASDTRTRVIDWLRANGPVVDDAGGAAAIVRAATGVAQSTLRTMADEGLLKTDRNDRRWYRIAAKGRAGRPAASTSTNGTRSPAPVADPGFDLVVTVTAQTAGRVLALLRDVGVQFVTLTLPPKE